MTAGTSRRTCGRGCVCNFPRTSTLVDSGNLRFLATSSESVLSEGVPTFEECGYLKGMFGAYNEVAARKDIAEEVGGASAYSRTECV